MNATAPILKTKLYIPRVRSDFVPRSRLTDCLDQGLGSKLTLISAPAGFGKTTLLSAWARAGDARVAWLSLDEGDNDLVRFLTYIIAALQTINLNYGIDVLPGLKAPQRPAAETLLANLINEVLLIQEDFFLIMDDYHVITDQGIQTAITYLVDNLPAQMHLIIATRADPPIPLARLRAHGQLNELRLNDLRFTRDEAAEFLRQAKDLVLNAQEVATLASRTEGWAAGLHMAALSIQGRQDTAGFIQAFAGSHRYILDYLVAEVLQRQSQEIQSFLLRTSILDRLHGPLCDAVLGDGGGGPEEDAFSTQTGSQKTLEYLESANLFILPLDDQRAWYRYHRLFADLLNKRLSQISPDLIPELHARASVWYQRNGFAEEAIQHALASRNLERAADLVEQAAESILMRGEIGTLRAWIEQLPDKLVRSRPYLDLYHLACLVLVGQPQEVINASLERLKQHQRLSSEITSLRAYDLLFQAEFSRADELSQKALKGMVENRGFFRSLARWIRGICQINVDDLDQRAEALENLVSKSEKTDNLMFSIVSLCQLAEVRMNQGQIELAEALYRKAIEKSTSVDGVRMPVAGQAVIGLGTVLYELNDLQGAMKHFEEGIELIQRWRPFAAMEGYLGLAMCRQDLEDHEGAQQAVLEARRLAEAFDSTEIDDRIVAFVDAQLHFKCGDTQAIRRYLEERRAEAESRESEGAHPQKVEADQLVDARMHKYEQIALARAAIAQSHPGQALAILDSLLPFLQRNNRTRLIIEVEILRSVALQSLGDRAEALTAIERALSLAEPGGYIRLFVNEGESVLELLKVAGSRFKVGSSTSNYIVKLLSAFIEGQAERVDVQPSTFQPETVIEPLSDREMEVLRYLRSSLTVPEIAAELYIAESTVRSHVKSIYSKLDVHRRTEAVQQAEEIGLLATPKR